jgi:hypothetical protein
MKQISICVGVILGCWVSGGAAKAEVFAKGSPVQILTKDKAVAGNLETDSNAQEVRVTTVAQTSALQVV